MYVLLSTSIHLPETPVISFFFPVEEHVVVYMYHIFTIDSSFDGHLGSFHLLVIGNKAAINTDVQVCLQLDIKSSTYARSGTA